MFALHSTARARQQDGQQDEPGINIMHPLRGIKQQNVIYNVSQNETRIILNILYNFKSVAMKFSM